MESSHKIPGNIMKWIIGKRIAMDNMTLAQCGIREDDCSLYLFLMPNAAGNPPPTAAGSSGFLFSSSYPRLPNLCMETVVDCVG